MEKNVVKGKVIEEKRYVIEGGGKRYDVSEGYDPIIDPQLKALVGREVEVLLVSGEVLAIRIPDEKAFKPQIIFCYKPPFGPFFDRKLSDKIQPIIMKSLLESNVLDKDVQEQLAKWCAH